MQCNTIQHDAVKRDTRQYKTCDTTKYTIKIQCPARPYKNNKPVNLHKTLHLTFHYTAQHHTTRRHATRHDTTRHDSIWHYTTPHTPHDMTRHYIPLRWIKLHYTSYSMEHSQHTFAIICIWKMCPFLKKRRVLTPPCFSLLPSN